METRNAAKYVLAFDNTNGLTTGVAASVIGANPVNIPVTIRDDQGNVSQRSTIALQGHGPDGETHFKDIKIKPLPDDAK